MKYQLIIKNARYYLAGCFFDGDILVEAGRIAGIVARGKSVCLEAETIIDAKGLNVLPGVIDSHVHFREPGHPEREDFFSGSAAAAAGGVTTYCEMPNACPPANNPANLQNRIDLACAKSIVDFAMLGAAGFSNTEHFRALLDMGVVAFKSFIQPVPTGREAEFSGLTVADEGELYLMLQEAAKTPGRFFFHCENARLIAALEKKLYEMGETGFSFHYKSRPAIAEVQSVETLLRLAKATGAKVGIVHITTPEACELVKAAKKDGVDVIAETCFHYLNYHHRHIDEFGPYAKCNPSLRSKSDMNRLWDYLLDGTITMIGSDHAPLTTEEKSIGPNGEIAKAFSGMPAIEMFLPMMLNWVNEGRLTLAQLVPLLSENTARLYGLFPRKGIIQTGADADFTIVDMNREYVVRIEDMYTKTKAINTLFAGTRVKGKPVYTIVRGRIVMKDGKVDTKNRGWGQYVPARRP